MTSPCHIWTQTEYSFLIAWLWLFQKPKHAASNKTSIDLNTNVNKIIPQLHNIPFETSLYTLLGFYRNRNLEWLIISISSKHTYPEHENRCCQLVVAKHCRWANSEAHANSADGDTQTGPNNSHWATAATTQAAENTSSARASFP